MKAPRWLMITTLALTLVFALHASVASAHSPSTGHVRLLVDSRDVRGAVQLAISDLDAALWLDRDSNGDVTWAELVAAEPRVVAYVTERLTWKPARGAMWPMGCCA